MAYPRSMLLVLTALFWSALAPAETLTDAQLVAAVREYQRHAVHALPMPGPQRRKRLLDGHLVKMRLPGAPGEPIGALAMVVSPLSKAELWIGSSDTDTEATPEVTSQHLPTTGDELFRWYGLVDVPKPFTDRHFLIHTLVNRALFEKTEGRMWGRHWEGVEGGEAMMAARVEAGSVPGVTPERFDKAVWVPLNEGAWFFIGLPDGRTLFGYQARASFGGNVPDGVVNKMIYWGLGRLMGDVLADAEGAKAHYRAGHDPLPGPEATPLPVFP